MKTVEIKGDILALSVATVPNPQNEVIGKMLKVPTNQDGFFLEAHVKLRPVEFATDGVFFCGLAHAPKFSGESLVQARAAVSRASRHSDQGLYPVGRQDGLCEQGAVHGLRALRAELSLRRHSRRCRWRHAPWSIRCCAKAAAFARHLAG